MRIYRVGESSEREEILAQLGVEPTGISIMSKKMQLLWIAIRGLPTPAANILKQDALSIGAELAVPRDTVLCRRDRIDSLLIANRKQIEILSRKERVQPFGLEKLACTLESFLVREPNEISLMAVLNINSDSFYPKSRFEARFAVEEARRMIDLGADIVDIGAVSSRPGSKSVQEEEELARLVPLLDAIEESGLSERALFSIDSHTPVVVEYALKRGFRLVNDIRGASDARLVELAVEYGARYCIMHMQGEPENMQKAPSYEDVTAEVGEFFEERIERCEKIGLKRDEIILDVGIGFGKSLQHNLTLLKNHKNFLRYGCELLVGASRKSMIDAIYPSPVEERLPGTIAIHLKAIENGASIVRCHDVAEHRQAIALWRAMS
jgi:dihydropteroate synthase